MEMKHILVHHILVDDAGDWFSLWGGYAEPGELCLRLLRFSELFQLVEPSASQN